MRIAFITTEFVTEKNYDGGLANYLLRMCLSLVQEGHCPVIFVSSDRNETLYYKGIEVHRINTQLNLFLGRLNKLFFRKFTTLFHYLYQSYKLNIALHHIHKEAPFTIIQYTSCQAVGLFKMIKIPSTTRISSYIASCNLKDKIYKNINTKISELLENFALCLADSLYSPSRKTALLVEKLLKKKVKIISPIFFLESETLDPSLYFSKLDQKKYLLFYGSISLLKGALEIAEIIFTLLSENPDLNFVFIGKDMRDDKNNSIINSILLKSGIHKNRIFHFEKMSHDKLYPIIKNSIAVILPSRIDNFPNTCLESMALGKIVVGTKKTSFDEIITDEVNGFLCLKNNAINLLYTINKVLNLTSKEKEKIENNALKKIQEFSSEKIFPILLNYYQSLIISKNT